MFLYVPKCGGTSLGRATRDRHVSLRFRDREELCHLDARASVDAVWTADNDTVFDALSVDDYAILRFREQLVAYYISKPTMRYGQAHSPYNEHIYNEFHNRFVFITMLRDPVKMWQSAYFYNRNTPPDRRTHELSPDEYLDTDMAGAVDFQYVKFFGGTMLAGDYTARDAIDHAKRNLERFDLVGILEHKDDLLDRFSERFGVRLRLPHKNVTPKSSKARSSQLTAEIEDRIRAMCAPNQEVYDFAIAAIVLTWNRAVMTIRSIGT